jgi:ABC-type Mn2+/Zn2+ transport system permease subunit
VVETLWFVKWPLLVALLAGIPLAYHGVYLMERRMVFASVALAQAALAGTAAGFYFHLEPRAASLGAVALCIFLLGWQSARPASRISGDAALGILYVLGGGAAVLFLSKSAEGGLDEATLLFGSLLGVTQKDAATAACVLVLLAALHFWGFRRFLATTFDPETSRVLGVPVTALELVFYAGMGLLLAMSIGQIGVLLSFAYLVLPPVAGRLAGRSIRGVFLWAGLSAVVGTVLGTVASVQWDLPTGAAVCIALALPLPLAALRRG